MNANDYFVDYGIFKGKYLLVCIGNELNGDDGVGPYVFELIKDYENVNAINTFTLPENFLDQIIEEEPDYIIMIDAADFGGKSGEIRILDIETLQKLHLSTHRMPIKIFTNELKNAGIGVYLVGIQVLQLGLGVQMSSEVEFACNEFAANVKINSVK